MKLMLLVAVAKKLTAAAHHATRPPPRKKSPLVACLRRAAPPPDAEIGREIDDQPAGSRAMVVSVRAATTARGRSIGNASCDGRYCRGPAVFNRSCLSVPVTVTQVRPRHFPQRTIPKTNRWACDAAMIVASIPRMAGTGSSDAPGGLNAYGSNIANRRGVVCIAEKIRHMLAGGTRIEDRRRPAEGSGQRPPRPRASAQLPAPRAAHVPARVH